MKQRANPPGCDTNFESDTQSCQKPGTNPKGLSKLHLGIGVLLQAGVQHGIRDLRINTWVTNRACLSLSQASGRPMVSDHQDRNKSKASSHLVCQLVRVPLIHGLRREEE